MHSVHRSGRRVATTVATAAVLALTLSACGSPSGGEDGPVTISYGIWDENQRPAMEAIVEAFMAEHPDIEVDIQVTPYGEYFTKLQTATGGGSAPDVFWMNGANIQLYASNGMLAPLDVPVADYPEALVELYSYDGETYGAPKDFDTIAVWYNKALFDEAGVPYPEEGWTWDDLRETAAALTDPDEGRYGIAAAQYGQTNFYPSIAQAGGEVISSDGKTTGFGTPEAREGVQLWLDIIADGSSPTAQQMSDTIPEDMFLSGTVAMLQYGSWAAVGYADNPDLADNVDVAPLPAGPAGNQSVIHGVANVANAGSSHLDAAKEFALFASGEEAAVIQAESGAVIPAFGDTQQNWIDTYPEYSLSVFLDAVDTAVPFPVSKNTAAWVAIESETLAQVWSGALDLEEGMQRLGQDVQKVLDDESE